MDLHVNSKMTSLEIAELTGKRHADLMKAIRKMETAWLKIGGGNFSLSYYRTDQNKDSPMYELSKKECLYIATKFNDEARARLVWRWEELEKGQNSLMKSDPIISLRLEQLNLEQRISKLETKFTTNPEYYTIVGYGTLHNISVNLKLAGRLGRKASALCKQKGVQTDSCPDPRFGKVKMYPENILKQVFEEELT